MSPTRSRSLAPLLVVPLLLGGGLLAGCGVSNDDQPGSSVTASVTPSPTPSDSPTPTVTVTATPSPTPSATAPASPTLTPEEALLTAAEVPPLNEAVRWKQGRTGPVSSDAFGLCAKFDVLSIGAEQAVERRFTATQGTATAGQQVATFPDATNTARATKVLQSWQRTCAGRVPGTKANVRPIESVPVAQGTGWWYLVSYTRGGQGHFHAFGVNVVGNRISLVSMDVTGADHDYPPGQDPVQLAVKAAAKKLG
jgi:hypothetical protein